MKNFVNIIIVGGGLSGLLTAWRCLTLNPDITVEIIDGSDNIGGDHTWSFNLSDIDAALRDWLRPFIAHQWPGYSVKFPAYTRRLDVPYCTGHSKSLRDCLEPFMNEGRLRVRSSCYVTHVTESVATFANGETVQANHVFDARGFVPHDDVFLGYQKFVGHTIKTSVPHGLKEPIIMDATVMQLGGYRFVYCLPFTETEILVEDTYYTDDDPLDDDALDARIQSYITKNLGVSDYTLLRRERGVLPITLARGGANISGALGIRGGFYHAVTGYSLPDAVRVADAVARSIKYGHDPHKVIRKTAKKHYESERFFRLLNRMLFHAARPEARYKVLERFYRLSEGLIRRFYAGELTARDKIRILSGKPPVPIDKALYNFAELSFIRRMRTRKEKHDT